MSIQSILSRVAGDTWRSWKCLALWPWPAVVVNYPHSRFTWTDYRVFTRQLMAGDFILTTSEPYFLSNRGISATAFKHLAVYTGSVAGYREAKAVGISKPRSMGADYAHTGQAGRGMFERTVTHAISDGVVCQDLGELLFHADWACAVRPWTTKAQREIIVNSALEQVGLGYDFDFKPGDAEKFFCTELGLFCVRKCGGIEPETLKLNTNWKGLLLPLDRFKKEVTVADAFLKEYASVCCSLSCNDPVFPQKSAWANEMRVKLLHTRDASG